MDTLRAVLVAWVIGGHALLGYSAIGGWAYDEVAEVTLAPRVELMLAAILGPSALFLMGTFFLVAGLFTPRSLASKGARRFALERGLRFGIPFLASVFAIWPLFLWLTYRAAGESVTYGWLLTGRERLLDSGALWFVEVLLVFSFGYLLVYSLGVRPVVDMPLTGIRLAGLAIAITFATFFVRLWFPARDTHWFDPHLWQWPQLMAMFALGTACAGAGIAERVPDRLRFTSGIVALTTVVCLPLVAFALGVDNVAEDAGPFLGGWHWESLLIAAAEAVLVVFGSIWLLGFAQRRLTATGRLSSAAARSSFTAFVVQGPVLLTAAIALRPLPFPAEAKAPMVAAIAIAVCFGIGWLAVTRTRLGRYL